MSRRFVVMAENCELKTGLLVGGIRGADVRVSKLVKHGFLFITHALGKARIAQALIAGRLGHVLQHTQLLSQDLLTIPRQLLESRIGTITDEVALSRRKLPPFLFSFLKIRALPGSHSIPLCELLANLALLIWRELLKHAAML